MGCLEIDGSRVLAAQTRGSMEVWLCWLGEVLSLGQCGGSPCRLSKTGGRLLMAGCGAEAQTRYGDLVIKDERSPEYFLTVTGEVSAHFYVTLGLHLFVHYGVARMKLLRETFVVKEAKNAPISAFVSYGYG